MAEQIGSTFANTCVIDKKGSRKQPVAVLITITPSCNDYAPMELGTNAIFSRLFHLCGRFGHKAAQCTKGKLPAAHIAINQHNIKGKQ